MWEPDLERAAASGPPVDPLTKRLPIALSRLDAPGSAVPIDMTCIGRESGPNQPRYALTSRSWGALFGRAKCSELPTDTASRFFEPTWKLRTRLAPRSVRTRPSRKPKLESASAPTVEAIVPPLISALPL